jgi:DNA transposition AAA+ family ATPase
MRAIFAKTTNANNFLAGVTVVTNRGAKEACMLLVTGEPGLGKSRTVQWWAAQEGAILLRAQTSWTPHWMLAELVTLLKQVPKRLTEDLHRQVIDGFAERLAHGHPYGGIVIDEAEHVLRNHRMVETVRDLSDHLKIPLILVGMGDIKRMVAAYPQVSSRISRVVEFAPASLEDVRAYCDQLSEAPIADDLVAEIHRGSGGRGRLIMNAIAVAERIGRRGHHPVTVKDVEHLELFLDWRGTRGPGKEVA